MAVLLMVSVPENGVAEVGAKVTPICTLCVGLSTNGRVMPVTANTGLLLTSEVMMAAELPVFVIVTGDVGVVAPTD